MTLDEAIWFLKENLIKKKKELIAFMDISDIRLDDTTYINKVGLTNREKQILSQIELITASISLLKQIKEKFRYTYRKSFIDTLFKIIDELVYIPKDKPNEIHVRYKNYVDISNDIPQLKRVYKIIQYYKRSKRYREIMNKELEANKQARKEFKIFVPVLEKQLNSKINIDQIISKYNNLL